ncbi:MAG TPA: carboxypeptidase-like regulatory domain-containing protein [Chitinophagaceae bacterium]
MTTKKYFCLLLWFAFFTIIGCQKEISNTGTSTGGNGGESSQQYIITTIKILVLNDKGIIVSKAKVQAENTVVYTDQFGIAELKNVRVLANKALVKINAPGYFEAYRTFAVDNKECYGKVKLQAYEMTGSLQSASGGTVNIGNEVTISFPPSAFINEINGSDYTGTVVVYGKYLNPEAPDFNLLMPGNLFAGDAGDFILRSFGMVNVEIKSPSNQPLKLKPNVKATIQATIPPSLTTTSPASIPMWYFDTTKGLWIQEGTGTKQGNVYTGEVSHFTWWNYDAFYPRIYISGKVTDTSGTPVVNTLVTMSVASMGIRLSCFTNNEGYFRTPSPPNVTCGFFLSSEGCNLTLYSFEVNAGSSDINVGTIVANSSSQNQFNITGNFQACSNQQVQGGSMKVYAQNNFFEGRIINGQAGISFSFCKDTVDALIIAEDSSTGKMYATSARLYKNAPTNLGTQNICASVSQKYIRYIVDNQMYYITGNSVDSLTSYYFSSSTPWVQVAHDNWSNPQNPKSKIYFNTNFGNGTGSVTLLKISDYPNLSNMGFNRELTNRFENYTNIPGSIIKGIMNGRMFDTGINQWRYIDVAYSVGQK